LSVDGVSEGYQAILIGNTFVRLLMTSSNVVVGHGTILSEHSLRTVTLEKTPEADGSCTTPEIATSDVTSRRPLESSLDECRSPDRSPDVSLEDTWRHIPQHRDYLVTVIQLGFVSQVKRLEH
jgi:hypothetical protein